MRRSPVFIYSLVSLFLILFSMVSCSQADNVPVVRIAVLQNVDSLVLDARGFYKIIDVKTGGTLHRGRELSDARVKVTAKGIFIGAHYYASKHIRVKAGKDIRLTYQDKTRRYRGELDLIRTDKQKLLVLNRVDLERYVKGVLYHEVKDDWPMEVIKAQAVATRTYALYQMKENQNQVFDVTSDIYSQVYGGKSAERFRTTIAANRTRGEVLFYQGSIFPAYFHSNSGGHTEDVRELWKHDLEPLYGHEDPYAVDLPNYNWKVNLRSKVIQDALNESGLKVGMIKDIRIKERNKSGRIRWLEIEDRNGRVITLTGKEFRNRVGPNIVRSNMYDIDMKGYYFDMIGKGWGHGVGMSQWGAYNMAKSRKTYDVILAFYYPQTDLINLQKKHSLAQKH